MAMRFICMNLVVLSGTVISAQLPADDPGGQQVKEVAGFLTGSFTSAAQAKADPTVFDVRLHAARIWSDRTDGHWIYVEQAMATALNKPYRQRVYRVVWQDGAVVSRVYTLPGDALRFAGAWEKPESFDSLKPDQLTERAGCAVILKKVAEGRYAGGTEGKGCASDLRGASYATSEVQLSAGEITSWDRGYDKEGKQVWGATKGPYLFKREQAVK